MKRWFKTWVISLVAALFLPGLTFASTQNESDQLFQQLEKQLVTVEQRIQDGNLGPLSIRSLRQNLQEIIEQIDDVRTESELEVGRIKRLQASLGPVPEDSAEDDSVQKKREELAAELAFHEGRGKRVGLIIARAEQALGDMTRASRLQFKEHLLQEAPSPISLSAWRIAIPEFLDLSFRSYIGAPAHWVADLSRDADRAETAIHYVLFSIVLAIAGWPLRKWLLGRFGRRSDISDPSYGRRILAAFVEAVAHGIIPVLFVIGVSLLFVNNTSLGYELRTVVVALSRYLVIFFIGYGLIKAVFTPDLSAWRLTPLHTGASTRVVQRLQAVLVIYTVFGAIGQSLTWATISVTLESVYAFTFAVVLYPALWALLRHRVWRRGGATPVKNEDGSSSSDTTTVDGVSMFWARSRTLV